MNDAIVKKAYATDHGSIVYWVTSDPDPARPWLVFLPGLTADHRLFDKQIEHFANTANVLVWDAPSHGESRPFDLVWTLDDMARWLKTIMDEEGIMRPVLVGQSLGGCISQAFMDLQLGELAAFVAIDSCPLQSDYYSKAELAFLRHTHLMFTLFPWNALIRVGSMGTSSTPEARSLMAKMMGGYSKGDYCDLSAHGYRALAEAAGSGRSYEIDAPVLWICGTEDHAGSMLRYSREWEKRTGHDVCWIEGAGHNANCDAPDEVNAAIEAFVRDKGDKGTVPMSPFGHQEG